MKNPLEPQGGGGLEHNNLRKCIKCYFYRPFSLYSTFVLFTSSYPVFG